MAVGRWIRRLSLFGLVLVPLLSGGTAWSATGDLARTRQELDQIQQRIHQASRKLAEKGRREQSLVADLAAVEKAQDRLQRRVAELGRALQEVEGEIAEEEQQAARLQNSLTQVAEQVKTRLRALYKSGDGGLLRVLFSAVSPARMAEDYDFFGRILARDRELIARYQGQLEKRRASLQRLADLRRDQQSMLDANRRQQQTLKQAGDLKGELLVALRRERADLVRRLEDLRDRAARLAELVKSLESQKTPEYSEKPGLFSKQRGHLKWPVPGQVAVHFGKSRHPDLGTLHESQGIEIGCGSDVAVHAVWAGRVIFASAFKGYGNLLIVDHGDGYYSLYAQAKRLEKPVGATVAAGEEVARSGFEGNPNLYFEIRQGGVPLNPEDWLAPR